MFSEAVKLNREAVQNLNQPKLALENLRKAQEIIFNSTQAEIPNRLEILATTYNNFACYYKSKKQFKVALNYLKKALRIELQIGKDSNSIALTCLNFSAVHSELSDHKKALEMAELAINQLQRLVLYTENSIVSNLIYAYYNAGVECEHLNRLQKAVVYLQNGLDLCKSHLKESNPLYTKLSKATSRAFQRLQKLNLLRTQRSKSRERSRELTSFRRTLTPKRSRLSTRSSAYGTLRPQTGHKYYKW